MSETESEKLPPNLSNPINQASLASVIIGLSTLFVTDTTIRNGISLVAPFVSYGLIYLVTQWLKERKSTKAIQVIEKAIARLRANNLDPNLPAAERAENEREIVRLNQLRTDTEFQQYDIK